MNALRTCFLACVAAVLGAGCDQLFKIDQVPVPTVVQFPSHVINDPTGDYDSDGDPNGTDLCPTIPNTVLGGTTDSDGDGVGDLCDPHPNTPGDCLVLFDDFAAAALDPLWKADGGPISRGTAGSQGDLQFFHSSDEIVWLDAKLDLDAVTVIGYVQEGDQGGPPDRHAIEIYLDLTRTPGTFTANGEACDVESNGPPSVVAWEHTVNGVDSPHAPPTVIGPELVGTTYDFSIDWSPRTLASGACLAAMGAGSGNDHMAKIPADIPPSGTFAIRGINVGLEIQAVAGWGHACALPHP
jgi:hypothetical protein